MRHVGRTDPLTNLLITEVTRHEFDAMPEYSCTAPTGATPGKIWRRLAPALGVDVWTMGYYFDIGNPKRIGVGWRRLIVVE